MARRGDRFQPQTYSQEGERPSGLRGSLPTVLVVVLLLVGIGIMAYPSVSNWWNSTRQSGVIDAYDQQVDHLDDAQ